MYLGLNMTFDRIKQKLIDILYKDVSALRFSLSWSALTLMLGFLYGSTDGSSYNHLKGLMRYELWAIAFGAYGVAMLFTNLFKVARYTHCAIDAIGLWLWTYLFLSFICVDSTPTSAAEYLLIIPIISSAWIITDRLFKVYIYKQLDLK